MIFGYGDAERIAAERAEAGELLHPARAEHADHEVHARTKGGDHGQNLPALIAVWYYLKAEILAVVAENVPQVYQDLAGIEKGRAYAYDFLAAMFNVPRPFHNRFALGDCLPGLCVDVFTGFGQLHAVAAAYQQLDAQPLFQGVHLLHYS